MEPVQFVDLNAATVFLLVLIGFIGGMVSGFIGSGGAFVLTPAMMSLGAPAIVAVASNICHKFPKALVGAAKRHKYGQVDVKLGVILGVFAELGMLAGKHVMTEIMRGFGKTGTDLYVSVIFIVVLAVVGSFVFRDYRRLRASADEAPAPTPALARWVHSVHIPGTMVYFPGAGARISLLFVIPIGFATGMLAATIAVGGFIGVPAMIYVLGVPAIMASATELVIAFIMGLGGTFLYGLEGVVDVRLAMLILLGSLFGIQLGAIGTTYVKDYQVKLVMAVIMLTVLFSRFFYIPGYLSKLGVISPLETGLVDTLKTLGDSVLAVALILGAVTVLTSLTRGIAEHKKAEMTRQVSPEPALVQVGNLDPMGRIERILLATDGSEYSAGAVRTAVELAHRNRARLYIAAVAVYNPEYASSVPELEQAAIDAARRNVASAVAEAAGVDHEVVIAEAEDPYKGIVEAAEEYRADLIVMGRRGRRGLARSMVGDATAKVIGHAPCNVMVVPRGAAPFSRGILVATDGSRYGDAAAYTASRMAISASLPLSVVSAVSSSHNEQRRREAKSAVERVKSGLAGQAVTVSGNVVEGRAEQAILEQARATQADLIVLGTHGRTGLDRLLMGSTTERVIGFADCAVLAVKVA
ncbi:MAG TPA: TSUP family transporter [Rhodocyclaceae bacterium]|nr:TSUP family transporter [Rhodocyclaceae bacterium]